IDAAAVGKPRVDHRARLVDAAPDCRGDALRDIGDMLSIAKTGPRLLELAVALDVNVEGPIGQDVGDLFVIEKRLEWPEAYHVVGELGGERGFFDLVELYVLLCRDLAHQVGDFRAQ